MESREPIPFLTVDFREEQRQRQKKQINDLAVSAYKALSSSEGQVVLEYLIERTNGKLIQDNVHQTVANAARRELVDELQELMKHGLDRITAGRT
jgi:predicted ArsR family transcriptional regulator